MFWNSQNGERMTVPARDPVKTIGMTLYQDCSLYQRFRKIANENGGLGELREIERCWMLA
jgi:hypothetical protein